MPHLRGNVLSIFLWLTYMATLAHLTERGKLKRYVAELEPPEQPERYVYASPAIEAWLTGALPQELCNWGSNLLPHEQVWVLLHDFVAGIRLIHTETCKQLDPLRDGVWELRTVDVRIFGWFPRRCTFLMVCGAMKKTLRRRVHYRPHIQRVIQFRASLDLDEPKAVVGGFSDVL